MRDQLLIFYDFLTRNKRWIVGGVMLTFFSSFGQTFFIASFAGVIRQDFHLTHGEFGITYMLATLLSAATLVHIGKYLDTLPVIKVALSVLAALTAACLIMAYAQTLPVLFLSLYLLRLFGQGMMTHTAMVAMGRWFVAGRGRAVSIASTGHQLGEGLLPLFLVVFLQSDSWRGIWVAAALALLFISAPLSWVLLSKPRVPGRKETNHAEIRRQWTRREALADMPFWAICTGVLAPAFIGTSVFFHQVHLAEMKGWEPFVIASAFSVLAITSIVVVLVTGHLVDRFSARQMLPYFLLPLSVGCALLALLDHPATMALFMLLLGMSYGISNAVFGAIWPEIYGTRHLGAIRAVVTAAMVFASALGPGLTGWLIDQYIGFEFQLTIMSVYCLLTMLVLIRVSAYLKRRVLTQG